MLKDKNIGIILLTETLGKKYPELVKTVRTEHKKPLLIEIRTATEQDGGPISSRHM